MPNLGIEPAKLPTKKLPEMTSCFIGFQNFPGEDPQPLLNIRKYVIYFFQSKKTARHNPVVQSESFKLGSKKQE